MNSTAYTLTCDGSARGHFTWSVHSSPLHVLRIFQPDKFRAHVIFLFATSGLLIFPPSCSSFTSRPSSTRRNTSPLLHYPDFFSLTYSSVIIFLGIILVLLQFFSSCFYSFSHIRFPVLSSLELLFLSHPLVDSCFC